MAFDDFISRARRAEELLRPSMLLSERLGLTDTGLARRLGDAQARSALSSRFLEEIGGQDRIRALSAGIEEWRRQERLRELVEGSTSSLARTARDQAGSATMRAALGHANGSGFGAAQGFLESDAMRTVRGLTEGPAFAFARETAERAKALALPTALAEYGASAGSLTDRIGLLGPGRLADDIALAAFARSAAMSDALALATRVDRGIFEAVRAYSATSVPHLGSLAAHRSFLDASGLWLPRWPRYRLVTAAEKRRRFRARLQSNAEPPHVKRAKSLVHRYERVLREIIDGAMAATYGEDWCEHRLPLCGCKTLLGRAAARGGDPLDHADYAHYRMIMSDPQHHAEVFSVAFEDAEALAQLIDDAGALRARSHHAGVFTPEDLRDLRVVWRTIEAGLLALEADFDVEWMD